MSDEIRSMLEKNARVISFTSLILFTVGFSVVFTFIFFTPSKEAVELKEAQSSLEQDLVNCRDSLDTWQTWCSIFEADIEVDAFGYPRFVCRQGEKQ